MQYNVYHLIMRFPRPCILSNSLVLAWKQFSYEISGIGPKQSKLFQSFSICCYGIREKSWNLRCVHLVPVFWIFRQHILIDEYRITLNSVTSSLITSQHFANRLYHDLFVDIQANNWNTCFESEAGINQRCNISFDWTFRTSVHFIKILPQGFHVYFSNLGQLNCWFKVRFQFIHRFLLWDENFSISETCKRRANFTSEPFELKESGHIFSLPKRIAFRLIFRSKTNSWSKMKKVTENRRWCEKSCFENQNVHMSSIEFHVMSLGYGTWRLFLISSVLCALANQIQKTCMKKETWI